MAGKGTEARRRAASLAQALNRLIDKGVDALADLELAKHDVAAVDRLARCVTNLARAGKAIGALAPDDDEENETEAGGDDGGDGPDDPEELGRLHAELWSRVQRIRTNLDAKRQEGWTYNPRQPGAGQDHSRSGEASVHA